MFIPDPDLDFLPIPDPGVKMATHLGSRIRIRNTVIDMPYRRWCHVPRALSRIQLARRVMCSGKKPIPDPESRIRVQGQKGTGSRIPAPGLKRMCNVPRALSRIQLARRVMCSGSSLPRSLTSLKTKTIFFLIHRKISFFFLFASPPQTKKLPL